MSNSYVLMTALPPTKGHLALIDFASLLAGAGQVNVIVCTQPSEPFSIERTRALQDATANMVNVKVWSYHKEISQDASKPEFWDMWREIMTNFGMTGDDMVVSSEAYGQKVADLFGAKFIPYDPYRELLDIKATRVRNNSIVHFDEIIPEFQRHLRRTVTVFGAESVGKTTTSRELAKRVNGHWRFEWARPYLEMVGAEVTDDKMHTIWHGQRAIQKQAQSLVDKPFIIQDTDLFSTVGYWEMWSPETMPKGLLLEARADKSDLYIILSQNIPFEPDPLRYGGDERESSDQYWIDLCEREGLNYVVIDGRGDFTHRLFDSMAACYDLFNERVRPLQKYRRKHNG